MRTRNWRQNQKDDVFQPFNRNPHAEWRQYRVSNERFVVGYHRNAATRGGTVGTPSLLANHECLSHEFGHVQSVDQLLALDAGLENGLSESGDIVCSLAAGTGYTWAATVLDWHGKQ